MNLSSIYSTLRGTPPTQSSSSGNMSGWDEYLSSMGYKTDGVRWEGPYGNPVGQNEIKTLWDKWISDPKNREMK